jgi:hypothetical protein
VDPRIGFEKSSTVVSYPINAVVFCNPFVLQLHMIGSSNWAPSIAMSLYSVLRNSSPTVGLS